MDSEDKVYIYDGDKLLAFNGAECAYNETTGMQTKYRGKSLGWTNRRVSSYKGIEFSYDGQGRRIAKGNISYIYDSQGRLLKQSNDLEFFYDHSGVSSVKHDGKTYFYRKDILGNIIALLDTSGAVVVKYTYDAWGYNGVSDINGNVISDENHIGNLNPFRYRGYYYDTETELYFLKTRYYDPEVGRFISPDSIEYLDPETINGLNLYAYCGNNPVMAVDPNGNKWWRWLLGGLLLLGGVILCCIPGGQAIGASLIVGGASITLSNIMSAAGVDGKTASLISSGLDIVSGIALCFVPGLQGLGASLIGSGVLGIAGGYISESLGGRFELGAAIGNIIGGFIGGKVYQGIQGFISTKTASKSVTEVGNYLLRDSSGTVRYTGVGSRTRMMTSLREKSKIISGLTAEFRVAPNRTMAFAREAMYLNEFGGARSMNQVSLLLNKINSPGLKYLFMWF